MIASSLNNGITDSNMNNIKTMTNATVGSEDILMGRGGLTNSHAGNVAFRKLVNDHQDEYLKARKKEKILISRRIVGIVHKKGGRFLQRSSDGESWVEVTEQRAQQKTSQALREGLDVRNSTVRESKPKRAADSGDVSISSNEQQEQQSPRKRQKTIVQGKVMARQSESSSIENSPSLGSNKPGGDPLSLHSIPALSDEIPTAFAPNFSRYQRQMSKSEVIDSYEV